MGKRQEEKVIQHIQNSLHQMVHCSAAVTTASCSTNVTSCTTSNLATKPSLYMVQVRWEGRMMGLSGCDNSQYPLGSMGFGQNSMTPSPYELVQLTRFGRRDTGARVGVDYHG
jgi:hypothetical protein